MTGWDPAALELIALLPRTGRGPKRDGIYALWLTLRVAQDIVLDPPLPERMQRKRLAALEARFSSLTLPGPLRRALGACLQHLKDAPAETVPQLLSHLVAPARESAGAEAAYALSRAARAVKQRLGKAAT